MGYDNTYQLTRERRSRANAYDITYTYDAAGNRRTKREAGVTTTYTCDAANQLSKFVDNTGTTTFTFDAAGNQRIEKTPAGALTTNVWDYENRLTRILLPASLRNTMLYVGTVMRDDDNFYLPNVWKCSETINDNSRYWQKGEVAFARLGTATGFIRGAVVSAGEDILSHLGKPTGWPFTGVQLTRGLVRRWFCCPTLEVGDIVTTHSP